MSGTIKSRRHSPTNVLNSTPCFSALSRWAKLGEIKRVIFGRPDRLGRDGEQAFFYYFHLLEQTGGLEVRFARDDVDPDDPFRNFKLFLYAFKPTFPRSAAWVRRNPVRVLPI